MLILTAFNSAYAEIGSLCVQSIARYCRDHPEYRFVSHLIPDDYDRPASWHKLELIKRYLPENDFVLWLDSDAIIIGKGDLRAMLKDATLNVTEDVNGLNCGIMAWKSCHEAFASLTRAEKLYEAHKDDQINVHYQPKAIFNAYGKGVTGESDVCEDTVIIHYPGMSAEERIPYMEEALAA